MIQGLCSLLWSKVSKNAGKRWPDRVTGLATESFDDVHETGGMSLPKGLTSPILYVGTESQLSGFTREMIRRVVPKEVFRFRDTGQWKHQSRWLENILHQHFPSTGNRPCITWFTPVMALIGRNLLKDRVHAADTIKSREVLPGEAKECPVRLGDTRFFLHAAPQYLARPKDLDDPPAVHVISRSRQLLDANGESIGRSARETMVFLAHPHVHAQQIQRCHMPANHQFYDSDGSAFAGGWLSTPHMTIIKVEPRGKSPDVAWARYLAYRFHRDDAQTTSLIFGEDDFQRFVDHHPALQRLLVRYTWHG